MVTMLPEPATIVGSPISPYVRKVLAVCEIKGVPYRLDPIVPFFGDDRFSELSPLRRIPVFADDEVSLCDSTVICEYLEERYPAPRMLPTGFAHRGQARWIEEFSDTRMGDVFIWDIFYEAVILPFVFQRARDKAKIAAAVTEQMPKIMAYLEKIAPAGEFIFGELSIADLAIAIPFSNLKWARVEPEVSRWLRARAWVERTLATTALAKLTRIAEKLVQTPPNLHRKVLADLAVPLTDATIAGDKPRSSIMLGGI
jgi:glutathione S-transferase